MKKRSKPMYDPDLGAKFLSDSSGLVIGRGKLSRQSSEPDQLSKYQDSQEAHDELNADPKSSSAHIETEEETEKDGIKAEVLRRLKMRQLSKAEPDRTRDSLK